MLSPPALRLLCSTRRACSPADMTKYYICNSFMPRYLMLNSTVRTGLVVLTVLGNDP